MELIRGLHNLRPRHRGCAVSIGNFDGVHLGHQAVLAQLAAAARKAGVPGTVLTFEPTAREFFAPQEAPPRISSLRERLEDLRAFGVERVLCVRFDAEFAACTAERFIREVLVDGLGSRYVAVGEDFRFGHLRKGDVPMLQQAGREHGFEVCGQAVAMMDAERISSSRIRKALAEGEVSQAARLLGRPCRISGRVVRSQQLGRKLGVPTANLPVTIRRAVRHGIYVGRVDTPAAKGLPAAVSLGVRPTIPSAGLLLEAYLLDFAGDLYGQRIDVELLEFLRPEVRFDSLDGLKGQMQRDIEKVGEYFSTNKSK